MKLKRFKSLTKLPQDADVSLFLIKEELKIRKFFNSLRQIGIEDCYYQPDLSLLILKVVGLDDGKDETFYHYSDLMDRRSMKITPDYDSITKQAFKAYLELIDEKNRLKDVK